MSNPKTREICKSCGKASIYYDASAYWDEEAQKYALSDDLGNTSYCGECGEEDSVQVIDIETRKAIGDIRGMYEAAR